MNEIREALGSALYYGCDGLVTIQGYEDACGKPATCLVDGRGTEDEYIWPACTYHAHRYGRGNVIPLDDIVKALREGVPA